jgi:carbon storage regulator
MLVLTRKVSEEIVLPQQGIAFRILEVRGDRVRIGISAPSQVQIFRREVWARINANGEGELHRESGNGQSHTPSREHAS